MSHFREAQKYFGTDADEYIEYPLAAWSFIKLNELDSAKKYLDKHLAIYKDVSEDVRYHTMYSLYLSSCGNYKDAYKENRIATNINNNIDRVMSKNDIGTVAADYHRLKVKSEKEKTNYFRLIAICVIVIFGLLTMIIIILYRHKYQEKIRNFENEMLGLIRKNNEDLLLKQEEVERILNERYEDINGLFDNYYYIKDRKDINLGVINFFNKMIEQCRSKEYLQRLEETINQHRDNVLCKIREQVNGISENEMVFITLIFSGFSLRAVCLIAGINTANYYTKRRRLRIKIENSEARDKSLIIAQFDKISNR